MIRSLSLNLGAGIADAAAIAGLRATIATPIGQFGILNIGVELVDDTETAVGLIVPATAGTVSTSSTGVQENEDGGVYGSSLTMRVASAWSVAPTFDASPAYLRQVLLPSKGASVEWSWPEDKPYVPPSTVSMALGLMLRNITGGVAGAMKVYFRWTEGKTLAPADVVTILSVPA